MKSLLNIIQEKLVINKHSKVKTQSDYYIVITESSKSFPELRSQYKNKMLVSKDTGWALFVLEKNEVKQINKDYIQHNLVWVYNILEEYKDDVKKFKDDYINGEISYFDLKNKNRKKLTVKDIENLD